MPKGQAEHTVDESVADLNVPAGHATHAPAPEKVAE
jgi:hypothetical protein